MKKSTYVFLWVIWSNSTPENFFLDWPWKNFFIQYLNALQHYKKNIINECDKK